MRATWGLNMETKRLKLHFWQKRQETAIEHFPGFQRVSTILFRKNTVKMGKTTASQSLFQWLFYGASGLHRRPRAADPRRGAGWLWGDLVGKSFLFCVCVLFFHFSLLFFFFWGGGGVLFFWLWLMNESIQVRRCEKRFFDASLCFLIACVLKCRTNCQGGLTPCVRLCHNGSNHFSTLSVWSLF